MGEIAFSEADGVPEHLDINSEFLAVVTSKGVIYFHIFCCLYLYLFFCLSQLIIMVPIYLLTIDPHSLSNN